MEEKKYNHREIEKKWQEKWEGTNNAEDFSAKEKKYVLIEFPYPSGAGLHVGHVRSYTALDVYCRKLRMEGKNVLYPIGWDAFGLPTENYAIKNKIHPIIATKQNIKVFKEQIKSLGISFDWSREINTTDPKYYKWTQWIFLKLLEKGLAYKANIPINWCPSCKIGLANEEVVDGKCERCGAETTKRQKEQWMLRITEYAEKLINDLDTVNYLDKIKTQQINWIGRSEGATIKFQISKQTLNSKSYLEVFTTRVDTIFGCTYLVVAPEHELISNYQSKEVKEYLEKVKNKSDLERTNLDKDKTGVELKGIKAINPVNGEELPIFVADYVLGNYGTGAVMAVPAHDERDYEFAKKYKLEIKKSINSEEDLFTGDGFLVNSGEFTGLSSEEAREKMAKWLEEKKLGGKKVNYKLRDWVFSRQHYWGEPIPVVHCAKCGIVPVAEKDLPIELPEVENYEPTDTGESPLAVMTDWVNVKCPKCGGEAKRETDTMPNWAGSSWYFLRYLDSENEDCLADRLKMDYWMPVDLYNGGMEHTTLHLLYSRFWNKFLYEIGVVPTSEPYTRRISHGMILAEDGRKMSKSFGNVINPNEIVGKYGADTLRVYEMFMGSYDEAIPWSEDGVKGAYRFLKRVYDVVSDINSSLKKIDKDSKIIHQSIKKVTEDIEKFKFNTAISALMICFNERDFISKLNLKGEFEGTEYNQEAIEKFLIILSPFAPHLAEELWEKLGNTESIFKQRWPEYDKELIKEEEMEIPIQINGKMRDTIKVSVELGEEEIKNVALESEKIKKWLEDKEPKKVIYIKGRMISIVL